MHKIDCHVLGKSITQIPSANYVSYQWYRNSYSDHILYCLPPSKLRYASQIKSNVKVNDGHNYCILISLTDCLLRIVNILRYSPFVQGIHLSVLDSLQRAVPLKVSWCHNGSSTFAEERVWYGADTQLPVWLISLSIYIRLFDCWFYSRINRY